MLACFATLSPQSIGKQILTQEALFGGDTVEEAGVIFISILRGTGTAAQVDAVTVNTGIAIHCIKPQTSLIDCIAEAEEALVSGKALAALEKLVKLN